MKHWNIEKVNYQEYSRYFYFSKTAHACLFRKALFIYKYGRSSSVREEFFQKDLIMSSYNSYDKIDNQTKANKKVRFSNINYFTVSISLTMKFLKTVASILIKNRQVKEYLYRKVEVIWVSWMLVYNKVTTKWRWLNLKDNVPR